MDQYGFHGAVSDPFGYGNGSGLETFDPYGSYTAQTIAADYADNSCSGTTNNNCPCSLVE